MATRGQTLKITELPEDSSSPDYFRTLVDNCVATYEKTLNDKLALDYNQVVGKMRSMVLDDEEYQKQTRSIKARRFIEEVEELDALEALAEGVDDYDEDDPDGYDPRNGGKKKDKRTSADKDEINLRFKLAQERREFLKLDSKDDEADETEALNLFFIPVTREEMERLETVEVNDGEYNIWETDDSDESKRLGAILADAKGPTVVETLYVTNKDGTIEEL